jgi:hypothetical protein
MPAIKKKIKSEKSRPAIARADQLARRIWKGISYKNETPRDKTMRSRLLLAVSDWLKSPEADSSALNGFSFTDPVHSFKQVWKIALEIDHLHDGDMALKIPAFNPLKKIDPPAGTGSMMCFIKSAVLDITTGKPICISDITTIFLFKDKVYPEKIYRMKATNGQGNFTVIRLTLVFFRHEENGPLVNIGQSSGLVAAIYRK